MITPARGANAFEALDNDWEWLCRRHRRSGIVAIWAAAEPALAHVRRLGEVLPHAETDRGPIWAAVARQYVAGDDLAGRVLLQLVVPGMVRLAMGWHTRFEGGVDEAGWDVVARVQCYIGRLRDDRIKRHTTTYVLRSVERDLAVETRKAAAGQAELLGDSGSEGLRVHRRLADTAPSAEQAYFASIQVRSMLASAVEDSTVSPAAAQRTWLFLTGHSGREVTGRATKSRTSVYREHAAVVKHLGGRLLAS